MTRWRATRARRVLAALLRIDWSIKRQTGSHRTLTRPDWPDTVFAFHENDEIGPRIWHGSRSIPARNQKTFSRATTPGGGIQYLEDKS